MIQSTITLSPPPALHSLYFPFPKAKTFTTTDHPNKYKYSYPSSTIIPNAYRKAPSGGGGGGGMPPIWLEIFKTISLDDNPKAIVNTVLRRYEKKRNLNKYVLSKVIKQLRYYKRYQTALEVYRWMNFRVEVFGFTSSDAAIQLDLISKVHGVSKAEEYFSRLSSPVIDNRVYGALLNAYVGATQRKKAEALMEEMRIKGYTSHSLPFNVIMTLYAKLREYDKVEEIVSEMKQKKVQLDAYSYNIWLSARGAVGSVESLEMAFAEMQSDQEIKPQWSTYCTMATSYIKLNQLEKAEECLQNVVSRLTSMDRKGYHFLLTLYGSLGKKDEVYRTWSVYKSIFPIITNWGYHAMLTALVINLGDIEAGEKIYEEWLSTKRYFDTRIANILLGWYGRNDSFEKLKGFFDTIHANGGTPSCGSWEVLAKGHIKERRISEALSCFRNSLAVSRGKPKPFLPKPDSMLTFLDLCEHEGDSMSKEEFLRLLTQAGCLKDQTCRQILVKHCNTEVDDGDSQDVSNDEAEAGFSEGESEENEMLLPMAE